MVRAQSSAVSFMCADFMRNGLRSPSLARSRSLPRAKITVARLDGASAGPVTFIRNRAGAVGLGNHRSILVDESKVPILLLSREQRHRDKQCPKLDV